MITLILMGICVVFWTFKVIADIVYRAYINPLLLILDIFCVIMWVIAFLANWKRYSNNKERLTDSQVKEACND